MVLRHLSTNFLMKCSVYVGVGVITSGFIMKSVLMDKVRRAEYFQNAMKIMRQHEGAKTILGEPIKETSFEYGKPNYADDKKAYFEVKVKGTKERGILFFWAEKQPEAEHWNVSRVELQLKNDDTRRLIIKKPPVDGDPSAA